ncbi:AraC family transcriptional regulator [Bacillus horti]|uniref:AraC-like DNA-binding protein n=1 Tax=Caldalkalibacillus horti TaxID=77523 RepID=A0ABT9VXK3_9BACI|nr:AraC family transcriptional regulator [Bacillus horti]MDQ0165620.1 AraC-like DNA-binding protein [Bacillus horti]
MIIPDRLKDLQNAQFVLHDILQIDAFERNYFYQSKAEFTLLFFHSGKGDMMVEEKTNMQVDENHVIFLPPFSHISIKADPGHPLSFYMMSFSVTVPQDVAAYGEKQGSPSIIQTNKWIPLYNTIEVKRLIDQMMKEHSSSHFLSLWRRNIHFQDLLYRIATETHINTEHSGMKEVIEAVKSYLDQYHMEPTSMKLIASRFGISTTNFSTIFKRYVGVPPNHYLTDLRMQRAKELLSSDEALDSLARKVGYKDPFYFSRSFKKHVGVPPTLFMKCRRSKRIMTTFHHMNDYLLALGLAPFATVPYMGNDQVMGRLPYLAHKLRETKIIADYQLMMELQSAKEQPDLVLGANESMKTFKGIEQLPQNLNIILEDNWRAVLTDLADLLGRTKYANTWLDHFHTKVQQARRILLKSNRQRETIMSLVVTDDELRIYGGRRQFGEVLYRELGLSPPKGIGLDEHYRVVELADLLHYDPDHLFVSSNNSSFVLDRLKVLKNSREWISLKAVRNDSVYEQQSWINGHAPRGRRRNRRS